MDLSANLKRQETHKLFEFGKTLEVSEPQVESKALAERKIGFQDPRHVWNFRSKHNYVDSLEESKDKIKLLLRLYKFHSVLGN